MYRFKKKETCRVFMIFIMNLSAANSSFGQKMSADIEMLSFDESGIISQRSQSRLDLVTAASEPTDVFIVSHGWNNNFSEARESYRKMHRLMQDVATRHGLLDSSYSSITLGLSWPSKTFDDDGGSTGRSASVESNDLATLYRAFPKPNTAGENYSADMQWIEELLGTEPVEITEQDYVKLTELFRKYRIEEPSDTALTRSSDSAFFRSAQSGRGLFDARISVRQALRMFSYWQMKERAGLIGSTGARKMLMQVQSSFPSSRIHMIGHSFGAKLILSCLGSGDGPKRNIDSLILLQGAVSYQAMSPVGGYANVTGRVNGPIIVTFTENDSALGLPYELASRAAGQTEEQRAISIYAALGRVGPEFGIVKSIVPSAKEDRYQFSNTVHKIYGSNFITGHGEFFNDAVARLFWAAILPSTTNGRSTSGSVGRSLDGEKMRDFAIIASQIVKQSPVELSNEAILGVYAEAIESQINAHHQKTIKKSVEQNKFKSYNNQVFGEQLPYTLSIETERAKIRNKLVGRLVDPRFFEIESFKKSYRTWIIDDRSGSAVGRILNPVIPCEQSRDTEFKQCVAICYRPDSAGLSNYVLLGSGTFIDWDIVLTAGHVVPPGLEKVSFEERERMLKSYQFGVCFGAETPDQFGRIPQGSIIVPVKMRIEHPNFNGATFENDLAIMKLERVLTSKEVFGEDGITELEYKLAEKDIWADDEPKVVTLVGYGYCDRNASMGAGIRRKVKDVVAAVPETETESRKIGCHLGKEFAAGGQGIDTCNGDSGGPVFAREKDGKWVLVGTTSRATRVQTIDGNAVIGNEPLSPCGDGGIYTLCWKHPWLRETIKKLQQP